MFNPFNPSSFHSARFMFILFVSNWRFFCCRFRSLRPAPISIPSFACWCVFVWNASRLWSHVEPVSYPPLALTWLLEFAWIPWNSSQCHLRQSFSTYHHGYRHRSTHCFLNSIFIRKVMAGWLVDRRLILLIWLTPGSRNSTKGKLNKNMRHFSLFHFSSWDFHLAFCASMANIFPFQLNYCCHFTGGYLLLVQVESFSASVDNVLAIVGWCQALKWVQAYTCETAKMFHISNSNRRRQWKTSVHSHSHIHINGETANTRALLQK